MSALDKLRRLRDRLVDFCGIRDRGYDGRREFSPLWVLDEIDRLLAEPETPEPAPKSVGPVHEPVLFHLDGGKVARAVRVGPSMVKGASTLVVDLTSGDGPSVVGEPDWWEAGYVAAYGGLVPECADQGTEPGQWSYGVLKIDHFADAGKKAEPAPPLTGPNYLDQEEWGHERGAVSDSSWDRCVFRHADGRGVYVESADVIRGDDVPSVVRLRLTGDMGPGTVFEYEIKPDERAAVPTDAEVEDAIESFEDATHIEARHGVDAALFEEFNAIKIAARDALRALIARRVAAAEKELDEARAELAKVLKREADGVALFDELLARERAEVVAQLKEKLTRWDIDYDRVHKEAKDLRAEVERLRAAAKDAAPAKETP